jgi:CheY-like chemotaxis protein
MDPAEALKKLEASNFDLLIADLMTVRVRGIDIIEWTATVKCVDKIVVMSDVEDPAEEQSVMEKGASVVVDKPLDTKWLTELIAPPQDDCSFGGRIEGVDLLEYIQFMLLSGSRTVVEVYGRQGAHGRIFIDGGRIRHAIFGELEGEEALFKCLCCTGGRFANEQWYAPTRCTVDKPGDFLLIEAARYRDEARNRVH